MTANRILLKNLKPGDKIVLPPLGDDDMDQHADVLSVEDDLVLVDVYGGDRDDDNTREFRPDELPESFETWD
jgi:hypothetical protein